MKLDLLDLTTNNSFPELDSVDVALSFNGFINFLQKRITEEAGIKKGFFEYVLSKLTANRYITGSVVLTDLKQFEEELSLIYNLLVPVITDEKQQFWALSVPLKPHIFFGTDAFYNLMQDIDTGMVKCEVLNNVADQEARKMKIQLFCSLILEKIYHFPPLHKNELSYSSKNEETGLCSFFKINIDTRFVEVEAKAELPELDLQLLANEMQSNDFDWYKLLKVLPLSLLKLRGFSVITATDITAQQAVEDIKNTIINRHPGNDSDYYNVVLHSLKTLVENNDIEFGLLPVFRVNNKLVFTQESQRFNMMVKAFAIKGFLDEFYSITEKYLNSPKAILYNTITEEQKQNIYIRHIAESGIVSYGLLPVYYGNKVIGILEVYSTKKNTLTTATLSKLDTAIPLLAQLLQHDVDEFNRNIENIIKDKFTSLQPAVEWKFRDMAWDYFDKSKDPGKINNSGKIVFKDVYPLYGAVDIRNSTIERNKALAEDLIVQFKLLIKTLTEINQQVNIAIGNELIYKCNNWLKLIEANTNTDDNLKITEFLDEKIYPFLIYFEANNPTLKPLVEQYWQAINEETGIVYNNRRVLENSMQVINGAINQYLDLFKDEVQLSYPSYFEKFRTDGIEYDIYIGQSITPFKPFDNLYLKNIRLWQLSSMIAIAKITNALLPQLEKKLQTTQLIFIRSTSIDIGFRNDERRFDVEGSYNIRYQVIKKRIDKVHIKDTGERLTQPNKIALVYFSKKEADEYLEYITYLQSQDLLEGEIEFLELEELQGVSGLKALRVTVIMDKNSEGQANATDLNKVLL